VQTRFVDSLTFAEMRECGSTREDVSGSRHSTVEVGELIEQ
jgi:hypothetical protein